MIHKVIIRSGLACALYVFILASASVHAAVVPGTHPKNWPANADKHKVSVVRESANPKEASMIDSAESAQPTMEALNKAAKDGHAPQGEKVWWYEEQLGIRIPFAITADAITYYTELVGKYGKQAFDRYTQPSSHLDYHASVKFHPEFKLDGKTFVKVNVVTMKLKFDEFFSASQAEGLSFEKERVVVLDGEGKVLHISGDGPTEVPILAI